MLSEEKHHAMPALSKSGIKKLLVSPMDYWLNSPFNYSPTDESPSRDMLLGKARHCLLLEGKAEFDARFCGKPSKLTHPHALATVEELSSWIAARGIKPVRTGKAALIEQVQALDPEVEILADLEAKASVAGKIMMPTDDYLSVLQSGDRFQSLRKLIGNGLPEVTMIWEDPDLKVLCKARLDWLGIAPAGHARVVELKDFSHQGKKSSLKSRTDQVFAYERHDIDVMFQARAWFETPPVIHGPVGDTERDIIIQFREKLPKFPPQNHPEMMILYVRKDSPEVEFMPRTVQLADQSGALTQTAATAWTSILNAAADYRENLAKYGPDHPWVSPWRPAPIEFTELPGFYQFA